MYVCICNNVTEKDIEREIRDGACSMRCLAKRLAVATRCGRCRKAARACLEANTGMDLEPASDALV